MNDESIVNVYLHSSLFCGKLIEHVEAAQINLRSKIEDHFPALCVDIAIKSIESKWFAVDTNSVSDEHKAHIEDIIDIFLQEHCGGSENGKTND